MIAVIVENVNNNLNAGQTDVKIIYCIKKTTGCASGSEKALVMKNSL